jgi:hypothetical protein
LQRVFSLSPSSYDLVAEDKRVYREEDLTEKQKEGHMEMA